MAFAVRAEFGLLLALQALLAGALPSTPARPHAGSSFLAANAVSSEAGRLQHLRHRALEYLKNEEGGRFGPSECVHVSRSDAGTCVLETKCGDGDDLEKVSFAFICASDKGNLLHSYGAGNFDKTETFDTGVECGECLAPPKDPEAVVALATPAVARSSRLPVDGNWTFPEREPARTHYLKGLVKTHSKKDGAEKDGKPAAASYYGPEHCVLTYRSAQGSCMMETRCRNVSKSELRDYDYGLTCVDAEGKSERHLFGTNSFEPEERFDTLIQCDLCLGLDATQDKRTQLINSIEDLRGEVTELKDEVSSVKENVAKLEEATGLGKAGGDGKKDKEGKPAAEAAEAETAPKEEAASAMSSHSQHAVKAKRRKHRHKQHKKHHKRHGKKHHHQPQDEEEVEVEKEVASKAADSSWQDAKADFAGDDLETDDEQVDSEAVDEW